jgi:hypothetical protein
MRRRIRNGCGLALLAMAPVWAQSQTAAPAEEPASVGGVVTNSLTGEPLLRAHIQLQLARQAGPGNQAYGAMSNSEGKFSISKIPPGEYTISMDRVGFVVPPDRASGPNATVRLGAGDKKDTLKLTMTPVGAIRTITESIASAGCGRESIALRRRP